MTQHKDQYKDMEKVNHSDAEYPSQLLHIYETPKILYVRGNKELLKYTPWCGVVGSRRQTEYGKRVITSFVPQFAAAEIGIISGLALGTDGQAHEEVLKSKGKTIAILGSGIDDASIYPRQHLGLARRIIKNDGLLISEYSPGTIARPEYFPQRNRIIAGISNCVLVIEAAYKSGALITARLTADAGKDVWAVPGNIFSTQSEGTNQLIQKGALPALTSKDMIESLGKNLSKQKDITEERHFSTNQKKIISILRSKNTAHIDDIQKSIQIPPEDLTKALTELELEHIVAVSAGMFYNLNLPK